MKCVKMNGEYYQILVDKFIFTVKKSLRYTENGTWVEVENGHLRVGVTDFLQKRGGDVVYIELPKVSSTVKRADEIVQIETIKTVSTIISPVEGRIVEVNSSLQNKPEAINEDPYGKGWLVIISPSNLQKELSQLLTAERYFEWMKIELDEEMEKSKKELGGFD
ncbi:MAG: glycine cleavage system protein GcvH [Candidatus Bathyarchaeota archaeon]|nr:MAG: glycine cleavage system protein GcvH [Candidatus Bathyarchaeota archaeon]